MLIRLASILFHFFFVRIYFYKEVVLLMYVDASFSVEVEELLAMDSFWWICILEFVLLYPLVCQFTFLLYFSLLLLDLFGVM